MPEFRGNTAYIDCKCFDPDLTFACGQAFRWTPSPQGGYEGVADRYYARIWSTDGGIAISPCDKALYEGFWKHYLDLDADYASYVCRLRQDDTLSPMAECCSGLRLLNQPVWECLVSFLLSSNNNVKRIAGIVERLCARYGDDMGGYHAFPTADWLAAAGEAGLLACGAGYRAAYVARAARAVLEGFNLEALKTIGYDLAKERLLTLHGVGEKVADCVLLFSCGYRQAFPVDVWVQRAVTGYYADAGTTPRELRQFAARRFGSLAGLAQQYLFHYERILKSDRRSGGNSLAD